MCIPTTSKTFIIFALTDAADDAGGFGGVTFT